MDNAITTPIQERNPTLANENLIKDRPEDLLLAELNRMREDNLTADRAEKILDARIMFSRCYVILAYRFFGLSQRQLANMDLGKRKTLSKLIYNRAKLPARVQILLVFLPLIGWLIIFNRRMSFNYRRFFRKLEKACGADNYFCNEIMTKAINGDYEPRWDD